MLASVNIIIFESLILVDVPSEPNTNPILYSPAVFVISVSATKFVRLLVGSRYAVSVLLAPHTSLPFDNDGAFVVYLRKVIV